MRVAFLALLAVSAYGLNDCVTCQQQGKFVQIMHPRSSAASHSHHQCFIADLAAPFGAQCVCRCSADGKTYNTPAQLNCGASHTQCTRCNLPNSLVPECTACTANHFVHDKTCVKTPQCHEDAAVFTEFKLSDGQHKGCENRGGKLINNHGQNYHPNQNHHTNRYGRGDNSWNNAEDHDDCMFTSNLKKLSFKHNQAVHGFKSIKVQFHLENPYNNLEADEKTTVEVRTCTDASGKTCSSWVTAHDAVAKNQQYTLTLGTNELDSIGAKVWVGGELKTEHKYDGLDYTQGFVQTRVTLSLNNKKEVSRKITHDIHSCYSHTARVYSHTTRHCWSCGTSGWSRCCSNTNHYKNQAFYKECNKKVEKKVFEVEEQALHGLKIWGSC
jgi:hypothetical protein